MSQQVIHKTLSVTEIHSIVDDILKLVQHKPIICLIGDLGAGKTTLVQHLAARLGAEGAIQSPSFGIVNEYSNNSNKVLVHADLYRLKQIEEFWSIGGIDYLESGLPICIEWPEILMPYLSPNQFMTLEIREDTALDKRQYTLTY